jgi:hypothetical protein
MCSHLKGHVVPHIRRLLESFIMEDSRGTIHLKQCCDVPALGNRARALILWSAWMRRSKELLRSAMGLNPRLQGRWSPDIGVSNHGPPGCWSLLAM